jgi:hypothetical protein
MGKPRQTPLPTHNQANYRRRLVIGLGGVAGAIVVVGIFLHVLLAWSGVRPSRLTAILLPVAQQLYPNAEGNLWAWYSSIMLALLGIMFGIMAGLSPRRGGRRGAYVSMGVVAVALSIDESTQVHENFGLITSELDWLLPYAYDWIIIGIPIAIVVGALLLWTARRIDPALRTRLIIAGVVYFLGAVGMETATAAIYYSFDLDTNFSAVILHEVVMGLEESLEFAGVLIAFAAALATLEITRVDHGLVVSIRDGAVNAPPLPRWQHT